MQLEGLIFGIGVWLCALADTASGATGCLFSATQAQLTMR